MELGWINLKAKCLDGQTLETVKQLIPSPEILSSMFQKWALKIPVLTHIFLPATPEDSDVGGQHRTGVILEYIYSFVFLLDFLEFHVMISKYFF